MHLPFRCTSFGGLPPKCSDLKHFSPSHLGCKPCNEGAVPAAVQIRPELRRGRRCKRPVLVLPAPARSGLGATTGSAGGVVRSKHEGSVDLREETPRPRLNPRSQNNEFSDTGLVNQAPCLRGG